MVQKSSTKKPYRSMQGKVIDMDMLRSKNELTPAVGNARVNARGDELGPGGKIIKKKEDLIKEYYQTPNAVSGKVEAKVTENVQEPAEKVEQPKTTRSRSTTKKDPDVIMQEDAQDEWFEDEDGNFVKRGE
jgi:hypothetical protein